MSNPDEIKPISSTNIADDNVLTFRQLRHEFMQSAITAGRKALDHIADVDPDLAERISKVFPNPGRAAFWITLEPSSETHMTPLQNLARGDRHIIVERLSHYTSPFLRTPR